MIRTFVYGTLKSTKHNNKYFLSDSIFLGKAWVYGELYKNGLPYLFKGKDKIKGEVYDIPKDIYNSIKAMEYNAGYYEGNIEAHLMDGKIEQCRVFYYSQQWFDKSKAEKIIEYLLPPLTTAKKYVILIKKGEKKNGCK